jgi:hypothetical protein
VAGARSVRDVVLPHRSWSAGCGERMWVDVARG